MHLRDAEPLGDLALRQVDEEAEVDHLALPVVEEREPLVQVGSVLGG